jgi:hypothetical protein
MNQMFAALLKDLPFQLEQLLAMDPVHLSEKSLRSADCGGVYLFTDHDLGKHLYVGRTKRRILNRLRHHVGSANDCPFAFRLAREATGRIAAAYSGDNTRKQLLKDKDFSEAYQTAKKRIKDMDARWVVEPDPLKQCLLEVYVAVALETPHNDFDTH